MRPPTKRATTNVVAMALVLLALLAGGCASTSPRPALDDVARAVTTRSGHAVRWNQGSADDAAADQAIDRLLARDLTVDDVVKIALLRNPALQAKLEEIAISQADLVQAGLLENPTLSVGRTAWEAEHIAPNVFATVEQSFLDLLTLPMRKRVAAAELEATKWTIADHVLELAAGVREAYYAAEAAAQVAAMRRLADDAAQASAELARRQHEAGNLSELALRSELALTAQVSRERLNKQMGVWGARTKWTIRARLPELPAVEAPLEHLESTAVTQRLDMAAARRNVQAMEYALSLAKTTRWTGTVHVSVEAGRLRHNRRISFGPSVAVEIPLFDQRQAQIAKLEAFKRQAERELEALAVDIRADVRSARARVQTARAVVEDYGKVIVPLRERIVQLSQEQYDAMLLGVYQLIQAKQTELEAYREYIEALRDYWIARSDLERAVGARLGAPAPRVVQSPAAPVAPPAAHPPRGTP